jgi:FAD/FMN-containing dehydrogenase
MQQTQQDKQKKKWDLSKIKRCEELIGQALLTDESTLVSFSRDFGKLVYSTPAAVCVPTTINTLQSFIAYAYSEELPIVIRGNGLSQCGQSLPYPGGATLVMTNFNRSLDVEDDNLWVEANCSWSNLLSHSLPEGKVPYILPYNCNLSVAGVLSAGGVGASSFKYGTINAYVSALEVFDGTGKSHIVDESSPLFHACLSGQGQFAVITKAKIKLRPALNKVQTFYLVYTNQEQWFADIDLLKDRVNYMELFCSPSIQGAALKGDKRLPIAQWLYALHISVEYDDIAPQLSDISTQINPWQVIHTQEESISSYLLRHNGRFEMMKMLGQWDLCHPWYECFVSTDVLKEILPDLLKELPIHYASLVHIAPVAKEKGGFLMLPQADEVCSFMILNPGVPEPLKDNTLQAIDYLDKQLLTRGGKRYLSGYLGKDINDNYWAEHFDSEYGKWLALKKQYDPAGIFSSWLYPKSTDR